MRLTKSLTALLFIGTVFLSSCATIAGGSKYNAVVIVDKPNAKIIHEGEVKGIGRATISLKRNEANRFSFTVKEDGCPEQTYKFTSRTFRGWAFVGTVVTWTGLTINGGPWLPIPFGVIVDGLTGAWWKPDITEKGVSKKDYKNFRYEVSYNNCSQNGVEAKKQE